MKIKLGFLIVFIGLTILVGPALSEPQELTGEVVRVNPDKQEIVLKINDEVRESREVRVRLTNDAVMEGVTDVLELKPGMPITVEAERGFFSWFWSATRLGVEKKQRGMNSVEKAKMDDLEQKAAEGKISPMELEMKKNSLQPGVKIEF